MSFKDDQKLDFSFSEFVGMWPPTQIQVLVENLVVGCSTGDMALFLKPQQVVTGHRPPW